VLYAVNEQPMNSKFKPAGGQFSIASVRLSKLAVSYQHYWRKEWRSAVHSRQLGSYQLARQLHRDRSVRLSQQFLTTNTSDCLPESLSI